MSNNSMSDGFDARYLSREAKACCKALHFTPRRFERLNSDRLSDADAPDAVLRIWNSKREIVLTSHDLEYANLYLL